MAHFAISVPIGSWHPFLPEVIASLKAQSSQVSVAFLDASNDERVKAVADANDDWLAYRRHGPDKGQSDAILEGWANTQGDWLGWLNADDILMPGALETIENTLHGDPSLDVIYGHSTILDDTGAMTGYHFNVEPPSAKLLEAGIISQPSCLFRRAAYEKAGGLNRDLHYVMDWDLWIRLYKSGAKFGFVEAPLSMVLWGKDTKTASLNKARRDELAKLIEEHAPEGAQKATFRDFIVHAAADMLWPPALKSRVHRHLRHNGPKMYGFRASGQIKDCGVLHLAHYAENPKQGVRICLEGDCASVEVGTDRPIESTRNGNTHIDIHFQAPIPAGESVCIELAVSDEAEPVFLSRAEWII